MGEPCRHPLPPSFHFGEGSTSSQSHCPVLGTCDQAILVLLDLSVPSEGILRVCVSSGFLPNFLCYGDVGPGLGQHLPIMSGSSPGLLGLTGIQDIEFFRGRAYEFQSERLGWLYGSVNQRIDLLILGKYVTLGFQTPECPSLPMDRYMRRPMSSTAIVPSGVEPWASLPVSGKVGA